MDKLDRWSTKESIIFLFEKKSKKFFDVSQYLIPSDNGTSLLKIEIIISNINNIGRLSKYGFNNKLFRFITKIDNVQ